jgi:hypothetical protein
MGTNFDRSRTVRRVPELFSGVWERNEQSVRDARRHRRQKAIGAPVSSAWPRQSGIMCSVQGSDGASEMQDALAIRALCERYALAVDASDSSAFTSVFTPDGHLASNYGGESHYHGHEQLAQIPGLAHAGVLMTMHVIGNHFAEVARDTATGITYCIANHLLEDRSNLVMMVRYDDKYARGSDGAWLIADRRVDVRWTETRQADAPAE